MKSKISIIQIFLLLASALVIAFVGFAVYQYQADEPTNQAEEATSPAEDTEPAPIEDADGLDEALDELESLDPDEELNVEDDLDESLNPAS